MTRNTVDRPYLETTVSYRDMVTAGVAEMIVKEDQIEHVRMEAGNSDLTLREAAVWMTDQLFPEPRLSND